MNFIEELRWRGMIHDTTPGIEEKLQQGPKVGYAGFDPTATSLHIGHLIPIMLLMHFQRCGHKPIALVGGATGMIGDPSGKSEERKLLSIEQVAFNQECIKGQLAKFLDFSGSNAAEIVNNYTWFKDMGFLEFLRDVGKYLTVNYMVSKDSVKNRWENGISYTEFSYQLLQAYDFCWLYTHKNCILQIGGSDQWGNITSGTELVRRKVSGEAFALTCPLLTRADGKKFGKTEGGESVWLDPKLTSPYKFYQYWLNVTDEDAPRLLRIFTLMSQNEIFSLEQEQKKAPQERAMQKALAKEITVRVHSQQDYLKAIEASEILFGKGTAEMLRQLSEEEFLSVFEGVPQTCISSTELEAGITALDLASVKTGLFSSKGEARRMISQGGLSINKEKITDPATVINPSFLINGKYILLQKGKKGYFIVKTN
jgi:tyrosyl-tRNA synthetase